MALTASPIILAQDAPAGNSTSTAPAPTAPTDSAAATPAPTPPATPAPMPEAPSEAPAATPPPSAAAASASATAALAAAAMPNAAAATAPKPDSATITPEVTPPPSLTLPPPSASKPPVADPDPALTLTRPAPAADAPARGAPAPPLPLNFSSFAADFKPKGTLRQKWLTVQVGTIEIVNAPPPNGSPIFVMPTLPTTADTAADFQPIEIACLLGAKSRYDNVTMIETDPAGNPLGYALPMGRVVYFIAREEISTATSEGISVSFYYYDASSLDWLPNRAVRGSFYPRTTRIEIGRDIPLVPTDAYVFIYLSSRTGPSRVGSTREAVFYTYLVFNMHKVDSSSLPPSPTAKPPLFMGEKL